MKAGCCKSKKFYNNGDQVICVNSKCGNYLGETTVSDADDRFVKHLVLYTMLLTCVLYSPRNYCSSASLPPFQAKEKQQKTEVVMQVPLTLENVKKEIERLGMVCPDVVLAQVKLESGHLTSSLLKRSNNMFGMRFPMRRPTTAIGLYIPALDSVVVINKREEAKKFAEYSSYAVYSTWQDAIADYKLWQEHAFRVNEKYIQFLGKYYAEDTMYMQRVQYLARRD